MRLPRFPILPPWRGLPLALICALYLFAGLTGHDPWKNDDVLHFGIAWEIYQGGDWLAPQLAGRPWLDTPPLYYWIAALNGHLFGGLLPLHDAIRLTSGLFGALFLALLAFAGRLLHKSSTQNKKIGELEDDTRRRTGNAAPLIAIGCLGLLLPIHDTQPLIALLAASAVAYGGFALLPLRPLAGGILAGLGCGLGFLAGGILALAHLLPLFVLLPINRHWRSATALRGLAIALFCTLLISASWPLLLASLRPAAWTLWWQSLLTSLRYQTDWWRNLPDFAKLLTWFAWPALPLALWAVWLNRRQLGHPAIALPLIGTLTSFSVLLFFGTPRPVLLALPLLVPLILQAASSAHLLRRGAANAFDWFSMMSFSFFALLIWLGGSALNFGLPAKIARNALKIAPGYQHELSLLALALAAVLSLIWFWLIFASPRSAWRGISHWAAGLTLMWSILIALWLPWVDYGKSYRSVASALQHNLAQDNLSGCLAQRGLGLPQRISFSYFAGISTHPAAAASGRDCPLLLTANIAMPLDEHWQLRWEGHRPSDRNERFRLYQRIHGNTAGSATTPATAE
ncbi:MAG: hypothetical protein KUL75_07375 [Sterolibacterium sp.]|nr:hypothetical protein [Sterolibacterium sp.]